MACQSGPECRVARLLDIGDFLCFVALPAFRFWSVESRARRPKEATAKRIAARRALKSAGRSVGSSPGNASLEIAVIPETSRT